MSTPDPCPREPEEDTYDAWAEQEEDYEDRQEFVFDNALAKEHSS